MLSIRAIVLGAVVLIVLAVGAVTWLLLGFTGGDTAANSVQLDAIRTAGTLVVGGGGAAALLLAALRQRTAGQDLAEKARATTITEHDATERRVTELYTKAAEQLGNTNAPVRLAGLYALERLAQNHTDQRQTIVNVLCAYLRMPYTLPGEPPPDDADNDLTARHRERVQEREVRLTAQRILTHHLRPGDDPDTPATTFWADIDLDLTGATLIDLDFDHTVMRHTQFSDARFSGNALFQVTRFSGDAQFGGAEFSGNAWFGGARFGGNAAFINARVGGDAQFGGARFRGNAQFDGVRCGGGAGFEWALFSNDACFVGSQVGGGGAFQHAQFGGDARFGGARFGGDTQFFWVQVDGDAQFDEAEFGGEAQFNMTRFRGDAQLHGARFRGGAQFDGTRFACGVPAIVQSYRDSARPPDAPADPGSAN
ncbi:hypothetical protein BJP25_21385 [Actinokineospora bangkokensis]|uniref:Pentapeptide repeat-containing protein n=1 Tax=Actinokineospora bangkokensis TaxID=1193682 RepID=A0A1Q9LKT0_9PSEU|nr:hypothetical protein BJP25_21385 [Actinokineospora bangkokensis]